MQQCSKDRENGGERKKKRKTKKYMRACDAVMKEKEATKRMAWAKKGYTRGKGETTGKKGMLEVRGSARDACRRTVCFVDL